MNTIIPLHQPPNSAEWDKLISLLTEDNLGRQATVIVNPACGPGPAAAWPERREWLALMARLRGTGARLALYLRVRDCDVSGDPGAGRFEFSRRTRSALKADIALWREHFLTRLGEDNAVWWLDRHPASVESLDWPEVRELYHALRSEHCIANVRAVPSAEFVRRCPARALCVHSGRGWPPLTQPSVAGKPTAIIAAGQPGLRPGAKGNASYLYATNEDNPGGVFTAVSPFLPRILAL